MIALPLVYFVLVFAYFLQRNKRWGIDLAATTLLIVISFCAILIDINDIYAEYGINECNITLPTLFLFCLQWTLVLIPLHLLSRLDFEPHIPLKGTMIYALTGLVALSSFVMLANSLGDIRDALIMDLADVRNEHYKDIQQGMEGSGNYLMVIPSLLTNNPFPTLALFFWFYMKTFMKVPLLIRASIFIASIAQAIIAITISGRAAMIYWAFDFFLIYSFFYRYIPFRTKLTINLTSGVLGSLAATLFISITIARFDSGTNDPFASLYGYAGQHINNFCTMIIHGGGTPFLPDRVLPLLTKLTTGVTYDMVEHYEALGKGTSAIVNVFDTFGGEVFLDLGWIGYILMLLLLGLLCIYIKSSFKVLQFHHSFILVIFIAFFTHGLFAWPFTSYYATYALILIFICFFFFKYKFEV